MNAETIVQKLWADSIIDPSLENLTVTDSSATFKLDSPNCFLHVTLIGDLNYKMFFFVLVENGEITDTWPCKSPKEAQNTIQSFITLLKPEDFPWPVTPSELIPYTIVEQIQFTDQTVITEEDIHRIRENIIEEEDLAEYYRVTPLVDQVKDGMAPIDVLMP